MPPDPSEDKELFAKIAQGDETAFRLLFFQYLPSLHAHIQKIVRSPDIAQELIQQTFIRIWLHRDKLEEIDNPHAWIYRVAANECYSQLKKNLRERQLFSARDADALELEGTEPGPDDRLELEQIRRIVRDTVHNMPAQRKKIYRMSRDQGMKIPEIAGSLGISPHTVKNTLVSSLKEIREALARFGYYLPLLVSVLFSK